MNTNSKIKLNMDSLKANKEWVRHKVKQGHNVFRILPPFGEASNGYPFKKWQIIWGLLDPETGSKRPYASSLSVEKRDPVVEFTDLLRERVAKMEGQLMAGGKSKEEIQERLAALNETIRNLVPRTSYIYNAVDKSGVLGLLELKATAHRDLKAKMFQYIQDYNQDPTSLSSADEDSGVWFDVIRTGAGMFDTKYTVEKCQARVKGANGVPTFVDDRSPLPDSLVENYDNQAYDLTTIYRVSTYDELNEVLQANLDRIYTECPDANLSEEPNLELAGGSGVQSVLPESRMVSRTTAPNAPVRGFNHTSAAPPPKVQLKLKDEDDSRAHTTHKVGFVSSTVDDDFMKAADAILNG